MVSYTTAYFISLSGKLVAQTIIHTVVTETETTAAIKLGVIITPDVEPP